VYMKNKVLIKTVSLILAALMLLSVFVILTGCGKKDNSNNQTNQNSDECQIIKTTELETENDTKTDNKALELNITQKVLERNIYISYSSPRRCEAVGVSEYVWMHMFYGKSNGSIALAFGEKYFSDSNPFNGSASDAFDLINTGELFEDADYYFDSSYRVSPEHDYRINVTKTEDVTVNGIQTIRFTGTVKDYLDNNLEVYGYSFVYEGTPFMLFGMSNLKEPIQESLIQEIDAMMKTVSNHD